MVLVFVLVHDGGGSDGVGGDSGSGGGVGVSGGFGGDSGGGGGSDDGGGNTDSSIGVYVGRKFYPTLTLCRSNPFNMMWGCDETQ